MRAFPKASNWAGQVSALDALWQGLYQRGEVCRRRNETDLASKDYRRAVEVIEQMRGSLPEGGERARYLATKLPVYERLVLILRGAGSGEQSFEYAQRGKARAFLDLLGTRLVQYHDADRALGDEERRLQWKIRALSTRIGKAMPGSATLGGSAPSDLHQELAATLEKHRRTLDAVRSGNPRLASIVTVTTAGISDVKNVLRQDEALFDYYVTDQKTLLWVVTRSDFRCIDIPAGRHVLQQLVGQLRDSIEQGRGYDVKAAAELYRLLLQPGLSLAARKPHLIIAPHDVLCSLPFEALVVDSNGPTYAGDRWVISEYESASVLALNRAHPSQPTGWRTSLLALGDPVFEENDDRYAKERVQVPALPRQRGALLRRVTLDNSAKESGYQPWHRLPATGSEVSEIAALFTQQEKPDTLTGTEASEDMVKRVDHSKYRYEHYATHGALAGDVPGLKEPALVLSLPKADDESSDDGYLTMTEVFGLRLNADLVTLSACNTRMGETVPGEGLVGMTRAFMYAGTPSVVASLWSVADESTSKLMVAFYRHLREGKSKSEALALAKRELRRIPQYSNPFYWAPFVLVGEG